MRRKICDLKDLSLEIDINTLKLPYDYRKIMPISQNEYFETLEKLLLSENINEIKLGITQSRKLISSNMASQLDITNFKKINYLELLTIILSTYNDQCIIVIEIKISTKEP